MTPTDCALKRIGVLECSVETDQRTMGGRLSVRYAAFTENGRALIGELNSGWSADVQEALSDLTRAVEKNIAEVLGKSKEGTDDGDGIDGSGYVGLRGGLDPELGGQKTPDKQL